MRIVVAVFGGLTALMASTGVAALQCGMSDEQGYAADLWLDATKGGRIHKDFALNTSQQAEYLRRLRAGLETRFASSNPLFLGVAEKVTYAGTKQDRCNPCFYTMVVRVLEIYRGNLPRRIKVQYYWLVDGWHDEARRSKDIEFLRARYAKPWVDTVYVPSGHNLPGPGFGGRKAKYGIGPCEDPVHLDDVYKHDDFPKDAPPIERGRIAQEVLAKLFPSKRSARP